MKSLKHWVVLLGIFMLIPCYAFTQNSKDENAALKGEIFSLVNKHRKAKKLPPLVYNNYLDELADEHSRKMAKGKVPFGHDGFEERGEKMRKEFKKMRAMAENVAQGKLDAKQVMKVWLSSSGHKKNMEGRFEFIGIGIEEDDDGKLYFTQIFFLK